MSNFATELVYNPEYGAWVPLSETSLDTFGPTSLFGVILPFDIKELHIINYGKAVVIGSSFGVLEANEIVELTQGEALHVDVSFNYRSTKNITIHLDGFIGDPLDPAAKVTQEIDLPAASVFVPMTATVNIATSAGTWGIGETPPGTYNLLVRIYEKPDVYDQIPNCVTIIEKVGLLDTIMAMIPMFLLIMMMGMMMPMMTAGEKPKEVE